MINRMMTPIGNAAMMDTVCYIFVVSVGLALLFRMNASSGGLDIVAKLLNKYFHMELGKAMALPGMCVALSSVFFSDKKLVVLGILVCAKGLQNGLERVTKVMMICLLALIVVLAVHSLTLSGAAEGMKFYLLPSVDTIREHGLGSLITDAMNQAFFTLSLGIGAMEIFGSYMSDEQSLPGEAVRICILDTFVALMAGAIIFPACFTFGVAPGEGPALIFQTLPPLFVNMSGGRFWGTLFFLFMVFASFSTVLAVFENILAVCMDTFGISRKKAVLINGVLLALLSLPCVFGYNIWSDFHPILGKDVLDSEDFLVSNLLLPIGSLVYLLFCVSKWGWGFDKYLAEANKGEGLKFAKWLKPYFQFVLPALIVVIFLQGLL